MNPDTAAELQAIIDADPGNGTNSSGDSPEVTEHLTDLGNSRRFAAQHRDELRYVYEWGTWLDWDGQRWHRDSGADVMGRAKDTVVSIYTEAADADAELREAIGKHATKSEAESRLRAMISLAQSDLAAHPEVFDTDAWLLNCANGTVDLKTGELREHDRDGLITKLAAVDYQPGARSTLWEGFLARIVGADEELLAFLKRAVGYTLTGDTSEEVLFFAHGPQATGKSTFMEAIKSVMGDYAATADFEAFLARRGDAGIRNDIARLAGARMVASLEVDEGKRLAEGLVKQLTGGDTVAARFLHHEFFEFRPAFKLWLAANARPKVHANDGAMWRRIVQVPFTEVIPPEERDPDLKRRLKSDPAERSAILAWAVQGCLDWQREGLAIPDCVRDYTESYRAENDPLGEWLAVCCELSASAESLAKDLRQSYETWAEENGERPASQNAMAEALKAHGCDNSAKTNPRRWAGIELKGSEK